MKLSRHKRRAPFVPVASFGDIAFLLIIFFMVASVFMRESHIEVREARAPEIEDVEEIRVSIVMDRHGEVWLQGQPCPVGALAARVETLLGDSEQRRVTLKIDRERRHAEFGALMLALSEVAEAL